MEFMILQCWSCEARFYTASERSTHHLEAHERTTRADGTPLLARRGLGDVGAQNGLARTSDLEAMSQRKDAE
jgi:hypothetical protein